MFQWNPKMRTILKDGSTLEKEKICQQMVEYGYQFYQKNGYEKPRGWAYALSFSDDVENYIMEKSIPGTYTSTMVRVSANHAAFIADYGWELYCREMNKPIDHHSVEQFFYDGTFDDYDPKEVEITDPFAKITAEDEDDIDDEEELFQPEDDEDY